MVTVAKPAGDNAQFNEERPDPMIEFLDMNQN
jgi:hypothetical protein